MSITGEWYEAFLGWIKGNEDSEKRRNDELRKASADSAELSRYIDLLETKINNLEQERDALICKISELEAQDRVFDAKDKGSSNVASPS